VENEKTKERTQVPATVMFYATGGFETPFFPDNLKGLESFKGDLFHSARWRHDISLEEKRVGVIGNGCSAYVLPVVEFISSFHFLGPNSFLKSPRIVLSM
jgi:cation diffusion facilitator CzcD-associated flavoprotein CzcO